MEANLVHLKTISLQQQDTFNEYPFDLPVIKQLETFQFQKPITIFVGDNGTGKSTLLEGIAAAAESILIGGDNLDSDDSLEQARVLGEALKLSWSIKTKKGFFFRANEFIRYINRLKEMQREAKLTVEEIKHSERNQLEAMPHMRTLHELQQLYGDGLETLSHGESFLTLFQARFKKDGLYILDEPEAPLSPLKQLSLISLIKEMLNENGQFIIATHSPILMALPDADIYLIEDGKLQPKAYDELEHVQLTRDFLNDPMRFLRHL
nr:AAA family ATPase [Shouchella xiaoxiensis]